LPEHIGPAWTRNIVDLEPGISISANVFIVGHTDQWEATSTMLTFPVAALRPLQRHW
jgi:hypothetical protein